MFRKIVVPLDGSELAESALEPGAALSKELEAELILLHVGEVASHPFGGGGARQTPWAQLAREDVAGDNPPMGIPTPGQREGVGHTIEQQVEELKLAAEIYLKAAAEKAKKQGVEPTIKFLLGKPAQEIVAFADGGEADLIVMASHGHSGVGRWGHGNVVDKVLRASETPVMLIRASGSE